MLRGPKKYFFGLFLLVLLLAWWGREVGVMGRYPTAARTLDVGVIGSRGEAILFYRSGESIVVTQCEDITLLESKNDCQLKPGTVEQKVLISDFRDALKMALRVPGGDYDTDIKNKIEVYNGQNEQSDADNLLEKRKWLSEQITRVEAFIKAFGEGDDIRERLARLKNELLQVEKDLADHASLNQIVVEVNEKIEGLIGKIIADDKWERFVFSNNKVGLAFNLLMAYLRTPALSMVFQRIDSGDFLMGSPRTEEYREGDENGKDGEQVPVTISRSFEIMKTEVTQMQWFQVMRGQSFRV